MYLRNGRAARVATMVLAIGVALLSGPRAFAQDDAAAVEIQSVIQRSNEEQAQAIVTGDSSVLSDTSTGAYLRELAEVNQGLVDTGVTSITLTDVKWGPIAISGPIARATNYETWLLTYRDGTTTQGTDTNVYTLVRTGATWLIQSDRQTPGAPAVAAPPPATPTPASIDTETSQNWAGYATADGTLTGVTGTWTVPQPSSASAEAGVGATWVGIGGVTSRDLIQAGTQDVTSNGRHQFQTWIETLPAPSRQLPVAVAPGDSVTVSILEQDPGSGLWNVSLTNNTSGQKFETSLNYGSSESSAEWIEEAPSGRGGILPLGSFGTVVFTNSTAVQNNENVNLSQAGALPITMVNGNKQPLAVPSPITADGLGFTVTRTSVPAFFTGRVIAAAVPR